MQWNYSWSVLFAIAALGGSAAADEPHGYDPDLAKIGAPLFKQYCASCHGLAGRGDGPAAASLRTRPADLTGIAKRRAGAFPNGEIAQFIDGRFTVPSHGSREMPVWGQWFGSDVSDPGVGEAMSRGNIASLVEYLKSIQEPPLATSKPTKKR